MGKVFNIAGPCIPARHYMLSAMARLPEVMRPVEDESYFVVHAQRQCGKTTAFLALANEINTKAMALRTFTLDEVAELYQQHTAETGQVFEPGCAERAFEYSGGQPYLVNALAKWCVDQVCRHMDHLGEPEDWLVVFDPDLGGDWDAKLSHEDINWSGRIVHLSRC